MWLVVLLVPVAWALGTFPTAAVVARRRGVDITRVGSGNPGASNVLRTLGTGPFVVVMALDFCKGALAALVGLLLAGREGAYVLGVAAVVGHTFPLWRKGGKGVAAAGGALTVLYPVIVAVGAVVWLVVAQVLHKASVASLVVTIGFPIAVLALGYAGWEVGIVTGLAVLVVARHATNIRRLVHGEENELRAPGSSGSDPAP
jgi:glycerol-3-phosphate acyltransferase PlsY